MKSSIILNGAFAFQLHKSGLKEVRWIQEAFTAEPQDRIRVSVFSDTIQASTPKVIVAAQRSELLSENQSLQPSRPPASEPNRPERAPE